MPTLPDIAATPWRRLMVRWQHARSLVRLRQLDDDHEEALRADRLEAEYIYACEDADAALRAVEEGRMEG